MGNLIFALTLQPNPHHGVTTKLTCILIGCHHYTLLHSLDKSKVFSCSPWCIFMVICGSHWTSFVTEFRTAVQLFPGHFSCPGTLWPRCCMVWAPVCPGAAGPVPSYFSKALYCRVRKCHINQNRLVSLDWTGNGVQTLEVHWLLGEERYLDLPVGPLAPYLESSFSGII
jgi:hypothetical protein